MWAITSYFNPCRYSRRLDNYRVFRSRLRVPLVAVELSFGDGFDLTEQDADILIQLRGEDILWQKERLLNVALASVPSSVTAVAWLDCDAVFADPAWVEHSVECLREFPIVQLFTCLEDLGPCADIDLPNPARVERVATSLAAQVAAGADPNDLLAPARRKRAVRKLATGHAWAGQREVVEQIEFYDACIIGGGDRTMASAFFGLASHAAQSLCMNGAREGHYRVWADRVWELVRGQVGAVPGTLRHLWHGSLADRGWQNRQERLSEFEFNPRCPQHHRPFVVPPSGGIAWQKAA